MAQFKNLYFCQHDRNHVPPVSDERITYRIFNVATNGSRIGYTLLISLLSHPAPIRPGDWSTQPCLAEHFTPTAFCYYLFWLLLLPFTSHSFSLTMFVGTTFFLFGLFFANTILEAIYMSGRGQGTDLIVCVCVCVCVCVRVCEYSYARVKDHYLGRNAFNITRGAGSVTGSSY